MAPWRPGTPATWGAPRPFKITPNSVLRLDRLHAPSGPPSAASGFFWFQDPLHLGLPGTRSWHFRGLQDPAVSLPSGSGAAPLPVQRTRRRTCLDVRGSGECGGWAPCRASGQLPALPAPSPTLGRCFGLAPAGSWTPLPSKDTSVRVLWRSPSTSPVGPTRSSSGWCVGSTGLTLTFSLPRVGLAGPGEAQPAAVCGRGWLFGRGEENPSSLPCIHVCSLPRAAPNPSP